jgi:hypothetical protein
VFLQHSVCVCGRRKLKSWVNTLIITYLCSARNLLTVLFHIQGSSVSCLKMNFIEKQSKIILSVYIALHCSLHLFQLICLIYREWYPWLLSGDLQPSLDDDKARSFALHIFWSLSFFELSTCHYLFIWWTETQVFFPVHSFFSEWMQHCLNKLGGIYIAPSMEESII